MIFLDNQLKLVTGATGFIGRHLIKRLIQNNTSVRAIARRYKSVYILPGLSWVYGDLTDPDFLLSATRHVSTVFHLAAVTPYLGGYNKIWSTNVVGTKNLLNVCIKNGVEKFIYVSSVAAYATPLPPVVDEKVGLGGTDSYGRSKAYAEYLIANSPVASVILRPCQVYGEGDLSNFTHNLKKLLQLPILPIACGKDNSFSLIHVEDLADAIIKAETQPIAIGQEYNIAGSEPTSLEEMAKLYCIKSGHRQLKFLYPRMLIRLALTTRWLLGYLIRKEIPSTLRTYAQTELYGSILLGGPKYDISKARRDLGYYPIITPEDGISRLFASKIQESTQDG
jgi:nucleoside-diphosphate-sugar epimerase